MKSALVSLCILAVVSVAAAVPISSDDMWVTPFPGVTPLGDVGTYRIAYQHYGGEAVDMPPGWSGDFTLDSGIAFRPVSHGNRPALLLHCPWRGGAGKVFVDYFLDLPTLTPISLEFGIAMKPSVATVDGNVVKSDGVTFSSCVILGDEIRELMREHYTLGDVKPFRFDLSAHAGQRICLRLQTEPGPANSPSFDFSRFVDPTLAVGDERTSRGASLASLTDTKAYRALRRAEMATLNNRRDQGIVPSAKLTGRNSVTTSGGRYELIYQGDDCRVVFAYLPETGSLDDLVCRVDDAPPFRPCVRGGVFFEDNDRSAPPERAELVEHSTDGSALSLTWRYAKGEESADVAWRLRMVGKALVVEVDSTSTALREISLGGLGAVALRKTIPIPYIFYQSAHFLPAQGAFVFRYMDWTVSEASESPAGQAIYRKKLDGTRNPMHDVGYIAVSPDLGEVLPNIPYPASPYLDLLGPKMMLDVWSGANYAENAKLLEMYKSYGIDEMAIIYHVWQRWGYDVKLPDHIPANPKSGSEDEMTVLGATAKRLGYPFSLHENYIDLYPDAPSYTEKAAALDPKGRFWKAWYHKGTKVQSWGLRPEWGLIYAKQNSPAIHERYHTTAAYLDVHTCIQPWRYCDFDPATPMAGKAACRRELQATLFQYMRDVHQGPLLGEGSRHFYWAGLVDGVEAQVTGGEDAPVLVDFGLLKLHPQMVNHGMGYYTRWLRSGKQTKWGVDAPTPLQLDKYRAQELAYGNASFIGSQLWQAMAIVCREYHLTQPIQARYGTAKVTDIAYEVEGQLVSSSVAAVLGALSRLRVGYDSGLILHVNLGTTEWQVGEYRLPAYGFVAEAPDLLAYTALRDGVIVDYARTPDSLFVDSRTEIVTPWAYGQKNVEPKVASFEYLGNGECRIVYEWHLNDTFERDLHCFVHFQDMTVESTSAGIISQGDHALTPPTPEWRPGMVIADGPHTLTIPGTCTQDELAILIGLHRGSRAGLRGVSAGAQRIAIGRLLITREEGKITDIRLGGVEDLRHKQEESQKRFTERLNTAGKTIGFGVATTNGSFKLVSSPERIEVLPFPRNRAFDIDLNLAAVGWGKADEDLTVVGVDDQGTELSRSKATVTNGRISIRTGTPEVARFVIAQP